MKDVRIFYRKGGALRFVSHLDMNRYVTRLIRLADLPVWYTMGFNQHLYVTFALPLSLGFYSDYEVMDIRITDDNMSCDEIKNRLNEKAADGFEVFKVAEPWCKPGEIGYCAYDVVFSDGADTEKLADYLSQKSIIVKKRNKKGYYNDTDIAPKIKKYSIEGKRVSLILSAGNDNLNPTLLIDNFLGEDSPVSYTVTRKMLYDTAMKEFE